MPKPTGTGPLASNPPLDFATQMRRLTLGLGPMLWGIGVLLGRINGFPWSLAVVHGAAYAVSGLTVWLVFLVVRRPLRETGECFVAYIFAGSANIALIQPTRTPWPLWGMVTHGVIFSALVGIVLGFHGRWLARGRLKQSDGGKDSDLEV